MAVLPRGADVLDSAGDAVVAGDRVHTGGGHAAAVDDVRMERVGRNIGIFGRAHGVPLAHRDLPVIPAAGHSGRAALLLPAVDPVGELVVGDHVVELRGRLVVPGTPRAPVVHADRGALVEGQQDDVGVDRIDPDGVIEIGRAHV